MAPDAIATVDAESKRAFWIKQDILKSPHVRIDIKLYARRLPKRQRLTSFLTNSATGCKKIMQPVAFLKILDNIALDLTGSCASYVLGSCSFSAVSYIT
jgi:hypothetical protein